MCISFSVGDGEWEEKRISTKGFLFTKDDDIEYQQPLSKLTLYLRRSVVLVRRMGFSYFQAQPMQKYKRCFVLIESVAAASACEILL